MPSNPLDLSQTVPDPANALLRGLALTSEIESIKAAKQKSALDLSRAQREELASEAAYTFATATDPETRQGAFETLLFVNPTKALELRDKLVEEEKKALSYAVRKLDLVQWDPSNEDWKLFRNHLITIGLRPDLLPEKFDTQEEFQTFKKRAQAFWTDYQDEVDLLDLEIKRWDLRKKVAEVEDLLSKPKEEWGDVKSGYIEKHGERIPVFFRVSKSGQIQYLSGVSPSLEERDAAHEDLQHQRLREQVRKLWGVSEFATLDTRTARAIEKATVRASRYYRDGLSMDEAIERANNEIRGQLATEDLPRANPGRLFTNKQTTVEKVRELGDLGMDRDTLKSVLKAKGWNDRDAEDILQNAGVAKRLSLEEAAAILTEAGGDKEKARQIARERGYEF